MIIIITSVIKLAMESVCVLLNHQIDGWKSVQQIIRRDDFISSIVNYDTEKMMTLAMREKMRADYLSHEEFTFDAVNRASKACGPLVQWVIAQVKYSEILNRVGPLREEVQALERDSQETMIRLQTMETMIVELEASIARYKEEYAALISETQALKLEMDRVKTKVDRSLTLITDLSTEQERWESTRSAFSTQLTTLVGDSILSAAFLAYAGYYDQAYRQSLLTSWMAYLDSAAIIYKRDLLLIENLSHAAARLSWSSHGLPTDDLCVENAIIMQRHNRFPLIIDPSGATLDYLRNEYKDQKIMVSSFLDAAFLKNLESALRFGCPLVITDVESYDPIVDSVLNREVYRAGGRVLIKLGNQEIDFSPTFKLFLFTRDPNTPFSPDISSRVTFVNFSVTHASLYAQCLCTVLKHERPDIDEKRRTLQKLQGEFQVRLHSLETSLLQALSEAKGAILEDDTVVATLENLKREAMEVERKVQETDIVLAEVEAVTAVYAGFARSASSVFFCLNQMVGSR